MATQSVRVYLLYADEDYRFRDKLVSQAKAARLQTEFLEMANKQPWVERWKAACRSRIMESDGVMILLTRKTKQGAGVKWELECVANSGLPMLGVFAEPCDTSAIPEELEEVRFIEWDAAPIAAFLQSLAKAKGSHAGRSG